MGTQGHNGMGRDDGRFDDLPQVNVVVPNDASELDAEVRAYHRERRSARIRGFLAKIFLTRRWRRFGLSGPIVVATLLLVGVVASTLAILGPNQRRPAQRSLPLSEQTSPGIGEIGGLLPPAELSIEGRPGNSRELRPAVIVLLPPECKCQALLDDLFRQVNEYGHAIYLVGSEAMTEEVTQTAKGIGNGTTVAVVDVDGTLAATYAARGVTVVLVHADGVVGAVYRDASPGIRLEPQLARLASAGAPPSMSATTR